jgi:hypothetical protein
MDLPRCPTCRLTAKDVFADSYGVLNHVRAHEDEDGTYTYCDDPWHWGNVGNDQEDEASALSSPVTYPTLVKPQPVPAPLPRDWVILNVSVENVCGFCGESFDIHRGHACGNAAISPGGKTFLTVVQEPPPRPDPARHEPVCARTLLEGPGNKSRIHGCTCGAKVTSAEAYAAHVGWAMNAVCTLLRLYDGARDLVDYPDCASTLRMVQPRALEPGLITPPGLSVVRALVVEWLRKRYTLTEERCADPRMAKARGAQARMEIIIDELQTAWSREDQKDG